MQEFAQPPRRDDSDWTGTSGRDRARARPPSGPPELEALVRASRPQAEVELVTTLGAVVGTHAGPGTVGLFWYGDHAGVARL